MNKKEIIHTYKQLRHSEAPDLWSRIESGIDTAPGVKPSPESAPTDITANCRPSRKSIPYASLAAAALLFIVASAAAAVTMLPKDFNSAQCVDKAVINDADFIYSADLPEADDTFFEVGKGQTYATTPAYDETAATVPMYTEKNTASVKEDCREKLPADYSLLLLADTHSVMLPDSVSSQPAQEKYFTQDIFKDTDFLISATVKDISFGYNDSGEAYEVLYSVSVNTVYFQNDALPVAELTVTSPIVQTDNVWLYPLYINRTYLLPLKYADSSLELVYPYAPQIEVSLDGYYIFHSGWQSLITDSTESIKLPFIHSDDFYHDKMLIRGDYEFANDLTDFIKTITMKER